MAAQGTEPHPTGPDRLPIYSPAPWAEPGMVSGPAVDKIKMQPPAETHNRSPSAWFPFRLVPGVAAVQIKPGGTSYKCRQIVMYAPGAGSIAPNALSIWVGNAGTLRPGDPNSMEIPPGGAMTLDIDDILKVFVVGQNATDTLTGFVMSDY